MPDDHVRLEWELVVVEVDLLVVLVNEVVFQGGLMVNAGHCEASSDTKDNSLIERIVVGSTFLISLLAENWVLDKKAQCLIGAIPSCLLQVGLEVSYLLELIICQIIICSLEIHCHQVII